MYDPEKYKDMPVTLQIIGRRSHDEKVLAALKEIELAMGRDSDSRVEDPLQVIAKNLK